MLIIIKLSSPNTGGLLDVELCAQRHHMGHKDKTIYFTGDANIMGRRRNPREGSFYWSMWSDLGREVGF